MRKELTYKAIVFSFSLAIIFALVITLFVGLSNGQGLNIDVNNFYWNTLLINLTFMGDAFFAFGIIFFLLFFFNKKKYALKLFIAILISLSIIQIVKNIFSGLPAQFYFEEGVIQNSTEAFFNKNIISSHLAIAFTLASFFMFYSKNIFLKIAVIVLATLVGITRIFLAGDSLLALAVGLLPAIIATIYLYKLKSRKTAAKHAAYYYKTRKETTFGTRIFKRVTLFLQAK